MVNRKALDEFLNRAKKPVAVSNPFKPVVPVAIDPKDAQIAALEAQLAALKSLTVLTSEEKVS
jgi:hypothetical protein